MQRDDSYFPADMEYLLGCTRSFACFWTWVWRLLLACCAGQQLRVLLNFGDALLLRVAKAPVMTLVCEVVRQSESTMWATCNFGVGVLSPDGQAVSAWRGARWGQVVKHALVDEELLVHWAHSSIEKVSMCCGCDSRAQHSQVTTMTSTCSSRFL